MDEMPNAEMYLGSTLLVVIQVYLVFVTACTSYMTTK